MRTPLSDGDGATGSDGDGATFLGGSAVRFPHRGLEAGLREVDAVLSRADDAVEDGPREVVVGEVAVVEAPVEVRGVGDDRRVGLGVNLDPDQAGDRVPDGAPLVAIGRPIHAALLAGRDVRGGDAAREVRGIATAGVDRRRPRR